MIVQQQPRLSVLMPVYNGAPYLDDAIDSILAQDFRDFEFVIVDDGSTDATPDILARRAASDSRIVIVRNERNLGISLALNRGLDVARGEYVARQDADDLSEPGRFRAQVDVLDRNPDVALVSTNYHLIDARGNILQTTQLDHPSTLIEYLLNFSNILGGHSQVMFRRDLIRDLGAYSSAYVISQDYDLWTRVICRGRIVVLRQPGMRYRLHDSRITVQRRDRQVEESWSITRRMLTSYLERDLRDDELEAIASAWRQHIPSLRPDLAHAVAAEAFGVFSRANIDRDLCRRARLVTSQRFAITGAAMIRYGYIFTGLRFLFYSLRWSAFGVPRVFLQGVQMLFRKWRAR